MTACAVDGTCMLSSPRILNIRKAHDEVTQRSAANACRLKIDDIDPNRFVSWCANDGFSFAVIGKPRGMPRARMTRQGHVYTPSWAKQLKNDVALIARTRRPTRWPMNARYRLSCLFSFDVTISIMNPLGSPHGGVPDLDNCEKLIMDALKGIAWNDDRLVAQKFSAKRNAATEGTFVRVETIS